MNLRTSFLVAFAVSSGLVVSSACGSSEVAGAPDAATGPDSGADSFVPGADSATDPDGEPARDAATRADTSVEEDATPPPPPDPLVGHTLQVGARTRSYGVRVPKTYDPLVAYPVVMVFHGDGGTQDNMYGYFKYQVGSADEAILVYPSGEGQTWDLYTPAATNKDIAFLEALLPDVAARYSIDSARVFGFGWSNGAYFVNQVACRRSGYFLGVASHAGGAPYEPNDLNRKWPNGFQQCPGQTAVSFIGFHGLDDGVVGYPGGEFSATYWAYVNGCGGTRQGTTPAPCESHPNCTSGKPVTWCPIPAIGHGIWADAAKTSWDFFKGL